MSKKNRSTFLSLSTLASAFAGGIPSLKKFSIGVRSGNRSAPHHIQEAIITAAKAKRARRFAKRTSSTYAINNLWHETVT